jgi:hypothetical protein
MENVEAETNYLVTKGFSWSDVRKMESCRRSKYFKINIDLDKRHVEAINKSIAQ